MDPFASHLWAWIAVLAQVFLGGTPAALALSPACDDSACCVPSDEGASCCERHALFLHDEPCCECCADDSATPETPVPADASREVVKHWAARTDVAWVIVALAPADMPTMWECREALAPRSLRGFLESRLRV